MISYAGISIFLFGNKMENGEIVLSSGMQEEFDISKQNGNLLIPVASTGHMARKLWEKNLDDKLKEEMQTLSESSTLDDLKSNILSILQKVK